jgi:hypothetical protein
MSITNIPIFPYLPDWGGSISVKYQFTTAISITRREYEQRRSMYFKSRREVSCRFIIQDDQAAHLWHFLQYVHASVFLFPLIAEPIISTESDAIEFISPNLYPLEPLTDYHNVNRIDLLSSINSAIILYDNEGLIKPEGAVITNIVTRAVPATPDGALIKTDGWTRAFTRGGSTAYLGIPVILMDKNKRIKTDSTMEIAVMVSEIPGYDVA